MTTPPRDYNRIDIKVNGAPVTADINQILTISDLDAALKKIGPEIAYWSAIWAEAEAEKERVDAAYRVWRGKEGAAILAAEKGAAEWKVKQAIESNPMFETHKKAYALAERNVVVLKGVVDGLKAKAQALSTKGMMISAELRSTGMVIRTGEDVERAEADATRAEKLERGKTAMREANAKRRVAAG